MASLIPGYQYDIFISYRQKDNKYDGWVTKFALDLLQKSWALKPVYDHEVYLYLEAAKKAVAGQK